MKNMSKKITKKLMKVLNSHCHCTKTFNDSIVTFYPYQSSPLSAVWEYLVRRPDGVFVGRFLVDQSDKRIPFSKRYCYINAPEQLFAPRAYIEINIQIVNRLKERNQLYAVYYTWRIHK